MKCIKLVALAALVLVAAGLIFVFGGLYNVAADDAHSAPVYALLELVRDRSIAVRSRDMQAPPLQDPAMIAAGAQHYDAMCSVCHRAPGQRDSELRSGLYPQPPDLIKPHALSAAETFWIIKHGIKLSGMPAWGRTHDDARIWALVAFIGKLPELTPEAYQALVETHGSTGHEHPPHDRAAHEHPNGMK